MLISPVKTVSHVQSFDAHQGVNFRAVTGANADDPISVAADLVLGDVYALNKRAEAYQLRLSHIHRNQFKIDSNSELGLVGNKVYHDCTLILINSVGQLLQLPVYVEVDDNNNILATYLANNEKLTCYSHYELIDIEVAQTSEAVPQAAQWHLEMAS